jgi:hypothetical protein
VGHCCRNKADYVVEEKYFVCKECAELIKSGSGRVMAPEVGSVENWKKSAAIVIKHLAI